jgi:hypothetical protein
MLNVRKHLSLEETASSQPLGENFKCVDSSSPAATAAI